MTQEHQQLLLKDLSARLPYVVFMGNKEWYRKPYQLTCDELQYAMMSDDWDDVPYLRPMSSMTEEEYNDFFNYYHNIELEEVKKSGDYQKAAYLGDSAKYDWLNAHHFDYRYLIEKDLAIEVTEENNPYK